MAKGSDKVELFYFTLRARVEPIRLTLHAAGRPFEDIRLTFDEWPAKKKESPYGQMPFMVYQGKKYGESKAIASFFAKQCGLAGKSDVEALEVDEIFCLASCVIEGFAKVYFAKDDTQKQEARGKFYAEEAPKYLDIFEKKLSENKNGFFVGSGLTQADLTVYDVTYSLMHDKKDVLDDYPLIKANRLKVEANPKVKAYLDKRPHYDF